MELKTSSFLNYPQLLAMDDRVALVSALTQSSGMDFDRLLPIMGLDFGVPETRDATQPKQTRVMFVPTSGTAAPHDFVDYQRLDLGEYMACCQHYLKASLGATAEAVSAWFGVEHFLYFQPSDLLVTVGGVSASDPNAIEWTVEVVAGNYLWLGKATLLAVADDHAALTIRRGMAKGLILSDVWHTL